MPGAGDSGFANILDFPHYDMSNPIGRNANPNQAGNQTYLNNLDDLIGSDEGIQLDGTGIDALHYQSLGGLRNAARDLLLNQGIDVMGAPNMDDPAALEAFQLFHSALQKHKEDTEKRKITKSNLDNLIKAHQEKGVLFNRQLLDEKYNDGFIGNRQILGNTHGPESEAVNNSNKKLMQTPKTQEELLAMQAEYQDMVAGIDQQVQAGYMSQEQGGLYKRQLFNPGSQFDNRLNEAKLKTEDARRRSLNRSNLKKAKDVKSGKGTIADQFPRVTDIARFIANPQLKHSTTEYQSTSTFTDSRGVPVTSFESPFWVGSELGGKKGFQFEKFNELEDGNFEAIFTKKEKDGKDSEGQVVPGETKAEYVRFSKDNLLPVLEATMTNAEWRQVKKELVEAGAIKGGRLSVQDLMESGAGVSDDIPVKKTKFGFGPKKTKFGF